MEGNENINNVKEIKFEDIQKANDSIKTTDIKGKEYAEVNQRIKAFRMVYPDGSIITKLESNENGVCIFRASVVKNDGTILGTGTAYEKENSSFINKTSYIENCETSAVGRALGMAGFGIDTSVASAEEVGNAILQQENDGENKAITKVMEDALRDFITRANIENDKVVETLKKYGYKKLADIKMKDYGTIQKQLEKKE